MIICQEKEELHLGSKDFAGIVENHLDLQDIATENHVNLGHPQNYVQVASLNQGREQQGQDT